MSPVVPCPYCKKPTMFHDDEMEDVADGSTVCLDCSLETARNIMILDILEGRVVLPEMEEEEDE